MSYRVTEIVERAYNNTDRRIDQSRIDLVGEFWDSYAELLNENRFWWSRVSGDFNTVVGTASYNLETELGLTAPIVVSEIETAWAVESEESKTELHPIFDQDEQAAALEATTNDDPTRYFIHDDQFRLGAPANAVKDIRIIGWAGVNPAYQETSDTVPLMPGRLHYGLVIVLERRIYQLLYSQDDPRWLAADARLSTFIRAANRRNFTTNRIRQFSSGEAIRAFD